MDTTPQKKPTGSTTPMPNKLRIEGANDLFIWSRDGNWTSVVPFHSVVRFDDTYSLQAALGEATSAGAFDPGPWPDGWIGFCGADERLYFDCRGQDKGNDKPYTVWSIVTADATEAASGLIPSGPDDLVGSIGTMVGYASDYFEGGYTPVPV